MIIFDTDECLIGPMPEGLAPVIWEVARDVAETHLHDEMCTFFVPESATDFVDGGPISVPVCCDAHLATAIAQSHYRPERREFPGDVAVWVAPVTVSGYRADVLLIPDVEWLPVDIRDALAQSCQKGENDNA